MTPTADSVLAGLDPEQREAATALDGAVCILAGAGTGKTRAVTHRIAYGVHAGVMNPAQVLALTFTTKAAGELRSRLRSLDVGGVHARTFHSAALRQLRYFWPGVVGGELPELVASKARLVARAVAQCRLTASPTVVRDLAGEIEWAKVSEVLPDAYVAAAAAAGRVPPPGFGPADVARVYSAYHDVRTRDGQMDFEDVLLYTVGILQDHPGVAEQVRDAYRHLTVDEYQDVNPLQQRLLDLWLGDRRTLCVVGDPRQTIYSFTGATPAYLLGFRERHPDARVVRLVRSYRSTPQVVALANRVAAGGASSRPGGLPADPDPAGAATGVDLVAQRGPGPEPELSEHADEQAEAEAVVARVQRLVAEGVPLREVAVLFRVNAQSETYEQAFASAGLPYVVRGGERFFARPEVREAVLLIRAGVRTAEADDGPAALVRGVLASVGWSSEAPAGTGAVRDRWESLSALVRLADEVEARGGSPADLVAELDDRAEAQHAPAVDGVTLASLHAAKGLEWDAVFLVGLVDGTLPITHAGTAEQVEEERRLLYVGVTRARTHLFLSWALARSPGGRASRRPSRFLDGIAPGRTTSRAARGGGGSGRRRGPRPCRVCGRPLASAVDRKIGRCSGCEPTYDEELVERLRAWRLDVARRASLPAYTVFTDATLVALAETMPTDAAGLLAVPGIGPAKVESFGEAVLAVLAGRDPDPLPDPGSETGPDPDPLPG